MHGYTTAFTLSAVIFAVGAVLTGLLLPSGVLSAAHAQGTGPQLHDAPSTGAPTGVDLPSRNGRPSGRHERPRRADNPLGALEHLPPTAADTAARPSPLPRTDGRGAVPMLRSDSPLPGPGRWSVTGRVQQLDGTGQPDAVLTLMSAAGEQLNRTRADAAGSYRLAPPTGGSYLLICVAPGFQPAASMVAVAGTDIRRDITLTAATRITGRLRSGTNPVPDGLVTLMDGRGQTVSAAATDSTGTYLLGGLTVGDYTLTATAFQHRAEVKAVHLPVSGLLDLDIDLIASGAISGTVRAASDGRVLPESTVVLLDADGHVVANGLTDDHGRYNFRTSYPAATP